MPSLEQKAREAAEAHVREMESWNASEARLQAEGFGFEKGYLSGHAAAKECEAEIKTLEDLLKERWTETDAEIAALQEEVEDWREGARKAAGERCEDEIHCPCVPALRHEIAALRQKLAEAEGRAPRWMASGSDEMLDLHNIRGWLFVANTDRLIGDKWFRLMVPPVPLPEGEE